MRIVRRDRRRQASLTAAALMSPGPDGATDARAFKILEQVPELETRTYGPEARCDDATRAQLLAGV